ncbi:MAG: hypothetical protein COA79_16825 [Planctomycetota bacterium]|nr:MAG: hypothetical protein COA79_16825 [Planctomycetota bacterium]
MGLLIGGKVLVGLDIGTTMVKAIQLTRVRKNVQITGFGIAKIKKSVNDAIIEAFESGDISTRRVCTAISGRSEIVVKNILLPEVSNEEINHVMEGELDKYIPWEIEDCFFDCQKMTASEEESKAKKMKVLMIASKKSIINTHYQMLDAAGLKSKIIDYEAFSLGNSYELGFSQTETISEDITAIVDIGATKVNINIMNGTESFFTREIDTAGNDMTNSIAKKFGAPPEDIENMKKDPGEVLNPMLEVITPILEEISNEIQLSFDYFENQFDQQVRKILLCGGVIRLPGISDILAQQLNTPCSIWDPTEDIDIDGSKVDVKKLKDNSMILGIALGLASRV